MGKSIGILYLCTGSYYLFWEGFYRSFEKKFMPDVLKRYYVFTDSPERIPVNDRVKAFYIDPMPWPLITLMRFHVFCRFREDISGNDYLMFANSNLFCRETISINEFLPGDGEELSAVMHPGYWKRKSIYCPYERDHKSSAYVPYNAGGRYVMGGLYCGRTGDFMIMSEILSARVNADFSRNKIALWHDESQFNRYVLENGRAVKILTPSYGYPEGWQLPFDIKIEIRDKSKFFDTEKFKETGIKQKKSLFTRITSSHFAKVLCLLRDIILSRHL